MEHIKPFSALFLDRDGVINVQRPDDYVKSVSEFIFIDGVLDAFSIFSSLFEYILIVSNQRGVGKGVMGVEDLDAIHRHMIARIAESGCRIDRIYISTAIDDHCPSRKPNIGMAAQAKRDFPGIDFANSFMAGDSISDIQFANRAGIPAVLIGNKYLPEEISSLNICAKYENLYTFAKTLIYYARHGFVHKTSK
ncbi:MAG: HAD-IIIA family hydrolase [Dysgonamonadaceae bacterium]|jgi:histidinol-phosphate phosphatase family protein|nr:HAD-IIIA family hydrolase [Dysgonamonadaceae bacterium]